VLFWSGVDLEGGLTDGVGLVRDAVTGRATKRFFSLRTQSCG
jgi:hypothetical protein